VDEVGFIKKKARFEVCTAAWMKLPILQDTTLGCCVSRCRCYEGLECLFIGTSIATKGTFGLPDSEDESSTNV